MASNKVSRRYGFCRCICHVHPGVMHCMPCCGPEDDVKKAETEPMEPPAKESSIEESLTEESSNG